MIQTGGALDAAAWKVRNLQDFEARLEGAARRVDELDRDRGAAFVIYEAALMRSGRPVEEVREMVRSFEETFADDEQELTIPRVSALMNVEGDSWFFGEPEIRTMTGQLLGQFQHRVSQYNYVDEREVLRRWANSHDTRLFIRRRIHETEPIVGVVEGSDLPLIQYLRTSAGGNTVFLSDGLKRALGALNLLDESSDDYAALAAAEGLALRLELPAPIVGELLERLAADDSLEFPEPPPETTEPEETPDDEGGDDTVKPSPEDRAARRAARAEAERGEEPTRVQDPQASDAPGTQEEAGDKPDPSPPQTSSEDDSGEEG